LCGLNIFPLLGNEDDDIGEKKNVAADQTEIVQQLKIAMRTFEEDIKANVRPAGVVESPKPLTKKENEI
jgi:hypothetical protein